MTSRPDEVPGLPVRGRAYYIERIGLSPHEQQVIDDLDRRVILLDPAFAARFATTSSPHRRRGWWPFRRQWVPRCGRYVGTLHRRDLAAGAAEEVPGLDDRRQVVGIVAISDVVQRVPDEVIAGPRLLPGDVLTLLARPAHPDVLRSLHGDAVGQLRGRHRRARVPAGRA